MADFYCHKAKLVIEIDEAYHNNPKQKEMDNLRTKEMNKLGLKVIRFSDSEIFDEIESVIVRIKSQL